ncbi:MAG: 5-formyltetrahydrofolate cyclo-ligase [Desulfovibrio sp.]|jgi:5-formyltetrahydrofolate cyclo-ligase|nr:5-formyltetrahydrofolate cyclo-ligase [Desulfovibrio sp.]
MPAAEAIEEKAALRAAYPAAPDMSGRAGSAEEKAALRARYRALRLALSEEERGALSRAACAHLAASGLWAEAESVGLYAAVRGETDCSSLFRTASAQGKTVLLPLIEDLEASVPCPEQSGRNSGARGFRAAQQGTRRMRLVPCAGPERLIPGAFGIPEPPAPAYGEENDPVPHLLLVPGTVFDRTGRRLGQGGGFYDRFLARPAYADTPTVGLCYAFQIRDEVPWESFDVPLRALCTEDGLLWIRP